MLTLPEQSSRLLELPTEIAMYKGRSQLQLANISSMSKSTLVNRRISFREIDSLSGIASFSSSPLK